MRITIVANFPGLMDGSYTDRIVYLAKLMHDHGYEVELIASDFCHENKKVREATVSNMYPFKVTLLHEEPYSKNVSLQRLKSHYAWGKRVGDYLLNIEKPDVIYCAIPSLTASRAVARYCKNNHVKFVVDLQDLWPEAFAMAMPSKIIQYVFLPMKWYADQSYKAADLAVAVSETYVKRILSVNPNLTYGLSVYLGNDGKEFDLGREGYLLERTDDEYVLGYVGNMSTSYDIPCVLDALAKIKKDGRVSKPIRFVLIGGGVDEEKFKDYARKTYSNTSFLGRKSYKEMAGLLCGCDMVVNPIVKESVASIINKVGDYALSGKPVVNTQESNEYCHLINDYKCGINCECGNSDSVAKAIENLCLDDDTRELMGQNSLGLAKDKFDRRYTYPLIIDAIEKLISHNKIQ